MREIRYLGNCRYLGPYSDIQDRRRIGDVPMIQLKRIYDKMEAS
jgi:hypothetical protein